jgi:hypothetical protein
VQGVGAFWPECASFVAALAAQPFQNAIPSGRSTGPILLESTLSVPTATIHASQQHHTQCSISTQAKHTQPPSHLLEPLALLHNTDGGPWLLEDPFHRYEGPSTFGPGANWGMELPVHQSDGHSSVESLDVDIQSTLLPSGLLDSPPHQAASPPPRAL